MPTVIACLIIGIDNQRYSVLGLWIIDDDPQVVFSVDFSTAKECISLGNHSSLGKRPIQETVSRSLLRNRFNLFGRLLACP
jgi:hypothetical protein